MPECIICNNKESFRKKYIILLQCMNCSHIFADDNLDEKAIEEIYSNKYFFGDEYINYINDKQQIEKNSKSRLKIIKKYSGKLINKNLFEIGCAYGFFLNSIKNNFKNVSGIEINKDAVEYARDKLDLDVINGDFATNKNISLQKYNIFCMFDVIEHLNNPDKTIKRIATETNDETYIYITTGDIESLNARVKGKNWRLIHPPSHIHYFSKKTIKLLLEKNGFKIISIKYCGYNRNLLSILSKIKIIKNYFSFIIKLIVFLKLSDLNLYLNLYDIMLVVAKKEK